MTETNAPVGAIEFKIRFNTTHGDTGLYWRVIIDGAEHLVKEVRCNVDTYSESSYDERAGSVKFHLAGRCSAWEVDETGTAVFKN